MTQFGVIVRRMVAKLKRIFTGFLAIGLMMPLSATAENVYRWTDENGKVHFGRTLPPEYANMPHVILNEAGIVIERVDDPMKKFRPKPKVKEKVKVKELEPLFTPDEVRLRSDNLLMLRYHSEQELLDAVDNEVAQLGYDTRLIHQSQASALSTLRSQVSNAANRQRAGIPGDPELEKSIRSLRQRLRKSEDSLVELRLREVKIRASFQKEIERYQFLSNGGQPGAAESN